MFKQSVQHRRCLVAADGFYEWRRLDEKTKQPFDIHLKGGHAAALTSLSSKYEEVQIQGQ